MGASPAFFPERRVGRPSKFTEERQGKIIDLIRQGIPRTVAAEASGISESTFFRWMIEPEEPFETFASAVTRAEAEYEAELLQVATVAAATDGRLAFKILERRFPERWGRAAALRAARRAAENPEQGEEWE